ncbi:lytic transglycosylase domain-containing protein [Pseudomonas sp. 21LCFQ010]|uniref:lytic transglycosylase domain-containing protein n=1 Tax=Pseudomonas sp. 21LCFQ010 TaxID=2957506 RepID=UPI00209784CA|nr:lytic transglycosylase domain-containing protein [Pseudomonas sp. 21LCFQ010]MCO8163872.1 lytic transglycosylase domain-containing protein [Pseudomonas sp. 21LCFQ010]
MGASMTAQALALLLALLTTPGRAQEIPPPAYHVAAHAASVPSDVLYALAMQESGTALRGRLIPWPWTLNVATVAYRYPTRAAACSALQQAIAEVGAKRVDAGLGQLNIGWQRQRLAHPCDALDPYLNLSIAAQILAEHKPKSANWIEAAGRYHRPAGGRPAQRYRESFARHLKRIRGTRYAQGDL